MTRFAKEMRRKFPRIAWDSRKPRAFVIESRALVVFYDGAFASVLRVLPNGKQKELEVLRFCPNARFLAYRGEAGVVEFSGV